MGLKKAVNDSLVGLTGYQLTKHQPPAPKPRPKKKAAKKAAKKKVAKAPAVPPYPQDYDDAGVAIIESVKPWTMTSHDKLYALILALRYVAEHQIPGDVVECGVWRGGSMQAMARTLIEAGDTSRELHLFDTFEGMTEPTEKDLRHDGTAADALMEQSERKAGRGVWAYATLDDVKDGMSRLAYPADKVHYHQGKVEDTLAAEAPEQLAIVRLDTDWYESTKLELDVLWDRLVPGGVLMIDDYGFWQGSRTAVHEFLEETGAKLLLLRMGSGRIAVKPY